MNLDTAKRQAIHRALESIIDPERKKAFKSLHLEGPDSRFYEEYWDDYCNFMDSVIDSVTMQYEEYCNRKQAEM